MSRAQVPAQETLDNIKKQLKAFSHFLRRDFLAILVKMASKELGIRTVRSDWRTRKGMLAFMQASWDKILGLVHNDTIIRWYCLNFDSAEKFFSHRKLMMFIYAHWSQCGALLNSQQCIQLIKIHQYEIFSMASDITPAKGDWTKSEIGEALCDLIEHFKKGDLPRTEVLSAPQTQQMPQQIVASQAVFNPFAPIAVPSKQDASASSSSSECPKEYSPESSSSGSTSEYDDIQVEDTFDPIPFEMIQYETKDFLSLYHIDDPFMVDEYSI